MDDYPDEWSNIEITLWEKLAENHPGLADDWQAQALYDTAMFADDITEAQKEQARDWLDEYLAENYGFDFEIEFDWEGFREWYG